MNTYTSTILIVDDSVTGRLSLEALLMREGYTLEMAATGIEALEKASTIHPDLILLDVMMPELDGLEVCRRLRRDHKLAEVPIILITALDDDESRLQGFEAGADDFITKPYSAAELRARVRTITRLNRYRRLAEERERRQQAEADITRQLRHMHALQQIDLGLTLRLAPRDLCEHLVDEIMLHFAPTMAEMLLYDTDGTTCCHATSRGIALDDLYAHTIGGTPSLIQTILQLQAPLYAIAAQHPDGPTTLDPTPSLAVGSTVAFAADALAPLTQQTLIPLFQATGLAACYAVPLPLQVKGSGVLLLGFSTPITPTSDWLDVLEILAQRLAASIDNARLLQLLQQSYNTTLEVLVGAIDLRDKQSEDHAQRVAHTTFQLALAMGIAGEELEHIRRGALLHDIGKLCIPDHILLKPGPLNQEELAVMRTHPTRAYEWLAQIAYLRPALDIPYCHHERWDGTGYPQGLKGEQIPLAARIFAVVDVWDALNSDRPYRKRWSTSSIYAYLQEQAGKHFDPQVVAAFLALQGYHAEERTNIASVVQNEYGSSE